MTDMKTVGQEQFEIVAKHLFAQGEQSIGMIGTCAYRGNNGLKCAIGALIPDELYDPMMDNGFGAGDTSITAVLREFPEVKGLLCEKEDLYVALQDLHDDDDDHAGWVSTENMRTALRQIASDYGLDAGFLDTLSFANR